MKNMKQKRILTILLTLMMILTVLPGNVVFAETASNIFDGGTGTQEDPYRIKTLEQLEAFRDSVNGGDDYKDKVVKLTANIDMSAKYGADIDGNEVSWTPIGNKDKKFKGTFDGDGHIIENLYINAKESDYQGLFGYMNSGTIKNLGVSGNVTGQAYVGGIVGYVYSYSGTAVISNCYNNATVNGTYRIGGVVGYIDISNGAATISNCRNTGSINGTESYVGGVAEGLIFYKSTATISDCSNSGTITGSGDNVGGISGYISPSDNDCTLTISNCYNTEAIEEGEDTGGVIGYMHISGTTKISNCYNTGAVSSKKYAGGVIGYPYVSRRSKFELSDSYNLGKVSSTDGYSGGVVGFVRLVASYDYETLTISNCRNEGEVISQNAGIVGGVVAYAIANHGTTTLSNCVIIQEQSVPALNMSAVWSDMLIHPTAPTAQQPFQTATI